MAVIQTTLPLDFTPWQEDADRDGYGDGDEDEDEDEDEDDHCAHVMNIIYHNYYLEYRYVIYDT